MTASDYASFALVILGLQLFVWLARRRSRDRWRVSERYLRQLRRKSDDEV